MRVVRLTALARQRPPARPVADRRTTRTSVVPGSRCDDTTSAAASPVDAVVTGSGWPVRAASRRALSSSPSQRATTTAAVAFALSALPRTWRNIPSSAISTICCSTRNFNICQTYANPSRLPCADECARLAQGCGSRPRISCFAIVRGPRGCPLDRRLAGRRETHAYVLDVDARRCPSR